MGSHGPGRPVRGPSIWNLPVSLAAERRDARLISPNEIPAITPRLPRRKIRDEVNKRKLGQSDWKEDSTLASTT
jgi:hypothetical protein